MLMVVMNTAMLIVMTTALWSADIANKTLQRAVNTCELSVITSIVTATVNATPPLKDAMI